MGVYVVASTPRCTWINQSEGVEQFIPTSPLFQGERHVALRAVNLDGMWDIMESLALAWSLLPSVT